jgi:glycosyltransferase involved in cell wall biosynthesis
MKIDIIICTYNRAGLLKRAIESILACKVPAGLSATLTVVDNKSSDETKTIVDGFVGISQIAVRYLFEKRQGKSQALNTALEHVTGDLIAFTDDDITVDKGWIREMVMAAGRYPQYTCFGGKVMAVYPERVPEWLDINGSMQFVKSVFVDRDDGDMETEYGEKTIAATPGGVNMFFRLSAIEKNGLFRTDLGPVGKTLGFSEDVEYCKRLLKKGERFMYIPSAIIYHPVHSERLKKNYLLMWQYKCGKSEVRRVGGYKDTVKVFGVPRYLYRKLLHHSVGWWLSLQKKKRFYHRLRLYYSTGEVMEHLRLKLKQS